jgi:hypothetical protein
MRRRQTERSESSDTGIDLIEGMGKGKGGVLPLVSKP